MEALPSQTLHQTAVLKYWTQIEFFSPYLLDSVLDLNQHYQRIFPDQPCTLPWMEKEPYEENDRSSLYKLGYYLYLGLFSTEETADRARHVFCQKPSVWQSVDWRQCGSPSNLSCFARLAVTQFGTPLLGTLSLSTVPWAHGHLLDGKTSFLSMEAYWKSVKNLLADLEETWTPHLSKRLVKKPNESAPFLDHPSLVSLSTSLFHWAKFTPNDYPAALIVPTVHDNPMGVKNRSALSEKEVPILNSFFIQDLERAADSMESQLESALDCYLSKENSQKAALDDQNGEMIIRNALMPERLPKGRWPDPPSRSPALMQQFAVNQAFNTLSEKGLFSINGPPGTGKSTLLREIIAENIVARAKALSQFDRAEDAFIGKRAVGFGDSNPIFISELHHLLQGYEMVVASSNNAAVQNLSQELPLTKQLDPIFSDASYLKPVASRLLELGEKDVWGLISAALGNKENCSRLVERLFLDRNNDKKGKRIWDWIAEYQGDSFVEAKDRFQNLLAQHEALLQDLELLAFLDDEFEGGKLECRFEKTLQELQTFEESVEKIEEELNHLENKEKEAKELLDLLEYREKLWNQAHPIIVDQRVFHKSSKKIHQLFSQLVKNPFRLESGITSYKISKRKSNIAALVIKWYALSIRSSKYTQQKIKAIDEFHRVKNCKNTLNQKRDAALEKIGDSELKLLDLMFSKETYYEKYQRLKTAYQDIPLLKETQNIDDCDVQRKGYFQNPAFNQIRSKLFIAATSLHEAWLAETCRSTGGFRGNLAAISYLLQGKNPTTTDDVRLLWQSVFLLIPVISSTFASIGRLFRFLEPQSLGWLLIDEAGQALPQAAVGAIWRAKRVLSLGDPFQIEPISTVPPEIIDGMAKHLLLDQTLSWAPSHVSVQNLMDAATKYGVRRNVGNFSYWLGTPLRVHRRCIEPMFSLANEIAYKQNMILATASENDVHLPKSCWYDVQASVSSKQAVPAQSNELVGHLTNILPKMSTPDIFVISPFREMVQDIKYSISGNKKIKEIFKTQFYSTSFRSWLNQSIGTVHAFQGKQATVVFFVLGADETTLGSIEWATRKPNLLNVAATRARHRFYIIGDYHLWSRWPHFDTAAKYLVRIT